MIKKLLSMVTLTALLFTIAAVMPAAATGTDTNVVCTFAEGTAFYGNGAGMGNKTSNPDITPHSGDYYCALPGNDDYVSFVFNVPEGGDDANYILSFYAKTSVGKSLCVETVAQVTEDGVTKAWATYRKDKGLPYFTTTNVEGMSAMITGVQGDKGGEWKENRLEFYVPEDCNVVRIYFNVHFNNYPNGNSHYSGFIKKEDAYRAVDTVTIEKAPYNLIRNGGFDGVAYSGTAENPKKEMPYSSWHTSGSSWNLNTENGDTKLTVGLEGKRGANGAASCFSETVYLYPGKYMISYDVKSEKTQGRMWIGLSGTKEDKTPETVLGKYLYTSVDWGDTNYEHKHYGYFEISEALAYELKFNNTWLGGLYTFDNIKLVPFDEENGDLHFGTINRTEDVAASNYGTWVPTSTKLWFMTDMKKIPVEGDNIQAFGTIPTDGVATSAQVLTSVYKVLANGNRVLAEVKIDSAVPGQGFKGSEVTIPTLASGETVEVKAMVLNSLGELKAFGKDFILE